jgi:DNA-binding NarL/FixJ family response regulator
MIKVIIADDSDIIRDTLKLVVEQDDDIKVVGFASNGFEASEACDRLSPDIILMDIKMPLCNGIESTRLIKEKHQSVRILMLTTFDDEEYVTDAIRNGADGYVLKDIKNDELIRIIKSTLNGYKIVQESVFENIKKKYAQVQIPNNKNETIMELKITEREKEIIEFIVDGKSNKEIADSLNIAAGTVRNMISIILKKLNLQDRTQIAVFALKNNIV